MSTTATTPKKTILNSRQTAMIGILADISTRPGCSKADLFGGEPNKTRAGHYRLVDDLIRLGLVADTRKSGNAYSLAVTEAGTVELAAWVAADHWAAWAAK